MVEIAGDAEGILGAWLMTAAPTGAFNPSCDFLDFHFEVCYGVRVHNGWTVARPGVGVGPIPGPFLIHPIPVGLLGCNSYSEGTDFGLLALAGKSLRCEVTVDQIPIQFIDVKPAVLDGCPSDPCVVLSHKVTTGRSRRGVDAASEALRVRIQLAASRGLFPLGAAGSCSQLPARTGAGGSHP